MSPNAGARDESLRLPIDMIYAAAGAHPDAIALICGAARLSYADLVAAADSLAVELAGAGAGRDTAVGICLERSFAYVIAMLAACRAGAAFLPLDPRWPEDRLRFVLDDSSAPVVVTDTARSAVLCGVARTSIVADAPRPPVKSDRRWVRPRWGDLAYIVYTSGSTGEPKGVEIAQQNLSNLIAWHGHNFRVTDRDRASSVAGLGFDAAVWEVWPYLCAGASIVLADDVSRASPEALRRFLIGEEITIGFVPTPLAEALIRVEWPSDTKLRILLTGGDTLHTHPIGGLPFSVVNNYGPTECTVVATSGTVPPDGAGALPAIGYPIAGARICLLDSVKRPVACGEIGEICIGGPSVARGYRNRPGLTAEKFIAASFSPDGGEERLYRTGDLGRLLPDGQIEFHGRCDNQIKLRGHRIEPDEISAALDNHPLVVHSAVVARGEGSDRQLVAYVALQRGSSVGAGLLREFLARRLPDYMLPGVIVSVPFLPLTASGKVDTAALPDPQGANRLPETEYCEPSSAVERRIAAMISELLNVDRVGTTDNFFLLGGHSLLGTQLVLRARDAFGVELTLRDLFKAQTVAKLATTIERRLVGRLEQMSEEEAGALLAG